MDIIILHELFHTQGASYSCGKRTYDGAHVKGSDVLGKNKTTTTIDSKNDTYYLHGIKDCPDLSKSVYLTPTAEDSWDPYSVYCLKKTGNFKKYIQVIMRTVKLSNLHSKIKNMKFLIFLTKFFYNKNICS